MTIEPLFKKLGCFSEREIAQLTPIASATTSEEVELLTRDQFFGRIPRCLSSESATYYLTSQIGRGGCSEVFRAIKWGEVKNYAIKVILDIEGEEEVDAKNPFTREQAAWTWAQKHPESGMLPIHEVFATLVTEGEEDHVFGVIVAEECRKITQIATAQLWQVAEFLAQLHQDHATHGDVKRENIMELRGRAVLIDYGTFAEDSDEHPEKRPLSFLITAPEISMLGSSSTLSPRSDVWQFGCTVFEVLGGLPFQRAFANSIAREDISWMAGVRMLAEAKQEQIDTMISTYIEDPLAQNLLIRILQLKPERRLPMSEIVNDPFFKQGLSTSLSPSGGFDSSSSSSCLGISS